MRSQKIKFGDKEVDKKEFYLSKQAILLDSVDVFVDIQPLCVILPQMSGYIKYFDDGGKNMSSVTDDKEVYEKYKKIWNIVKKLLKQKFFVNPVCDDKYMIAKFKIFKNVNMTTFTNNVRPIEKNSLHLYFCNRY